MDDIVRQRNGRISAYRKENTYNSLGGKDTLQIKPEDEETVFAVFQLLSDLSANRKAFAQIAVIQEKGCHYLSAIPEKGQWEKIDSFRIDYLRYNPATHEVEATRRDILIRIIRTGINKVMGKKKADEFEEIALKYEGDDFLAHLFGIGSKKGLLTGVNALPDGNRIDREGKANGILDTKV